MNEKPHNQHPLVPPTAEMREYWEAPGQFVHMFAKVEKQLLGILFRLSGVSIPIGRAVFSGVKTDQAQNFIKRIMDVGKPDDATKREFEFIFTQLSLLSNARNAIVHWGTQFTEGSEFLVSNLHIAHTAARVREMPASATIIQHMIEDLDKISGHFVAFVIRGSLSEHAIEKMVGARVRRPWRYKPTSPSSLNKRRPRTAPKQKRLPQS